MASKKLSIYKEGAEVKITFAVKRILSEIFEEPNYKTITYDMIIDPKKKQVVLQFEERKKKKNNT
jgi:hypothetical protein